VKEIERYRDLFINREDAYATQRMDGSYICQKKEVTDKVLVDHLKGRITCGGIALTKPTRSSGPVRTPTARMDRSSFRE
jgi:hypothetical protein